MLAKSQTFMIGVLAGLLSTPGRSQAQTEAPKLTARELFYASVAPPANPKTQPARPKKQSQRSKPEDQPQAAQRPPASTRKDGDYIEAAHRPGAAPLGLKYMILKRVEGDMVEVSPGTVFRAGDRIRFSVEANDSGYLYIIQRGSSGVWKPMFPSAEIEGGDNRVEKGRTYQMPPGHVFTFDEQAGEEKFFIVLSRKPEPDLEKMIYSLQEKDSRRQHVLLASAKPIDDLLVGKLRHAYARDLIIEKVDEDRPGPKKEKAVYAVNASGSADSRVVADITLNHR